MIFFLVDSLGRKPNWVSKKPMPAKLGFGFPCFSVLCIEAIISMWSFERLFWAARILLAQSLRVLETRTECCKEKSAKPNCPCSVFCPWVFHQVEQLMTCGPWVSKTSEREHESLVRDFEEAQEGPQGLHCACCSPAGVVWPLSELIAPYVACRAILDIIPSLSAAGRDPWFPWCPTCC